MRAAHSGVIRRLVCIGIMILRVREPNRRRTFRVPFVPVVPLPSIAMCVSLMCGLPRLTWIRFVLWLVTGLAIYFLYGIRRSRLATAAAHGPTSESRSQKH